MLEFAITNAAYLCIAVVFFRWLLKQTVSLAESKRRLVRSGLAALLFAPGLYWYFAIAVPTFALLTPFLHLIQFIRDGHLISRQFGVGAWLVPQLVVAVVPVLLTWLLLFGVSYAIARHRERASKHA